MFHKEREGVRFRFRKNLDNDLKEATKNIGEGELSELCRNGLRLMLGIRTTRLLEVTERQIVPTTLRESDPVSVNNKTAPVIATGATWIAPTRRK